MGKITTSQKITPFLWFNTEAEEAMKFYTAVFDDSAILNIQRYGVGAPLPEGTVMSGSFTLCGQEFMALNGGPMFSFTPAISLFVKCRDQQEVDRYWQQLTGGGGKEEMCGWLKDKFGLSWQIIPDRLGELLHHEDRLVAGKVMKAMLGMKKIIVADLEAAAGITT